MNTSFNNLKFKVTILILITLRGTIAIGQYSDPTYESYVKFILSENVDTVVRFSLPVEFHYPPTINIQGLGNVTYGSIDYLFYRKDQKIYSRKLVGYYPKSIAEFVHISSKPIEINDDSIIQLVSNYSKELHREDIFPFTFVKTDTTINQVFYQRVFNSRAIPFRISIYSKTDSWNRVIELEWLQKTSGEGSNEVLNLNYSYNIGTHIYRLFEFLKSQTERFDAKYIY